MTELWESLSQILAGAWALLALLIGWLGEWWIAIAWLAWWLWAVDWNKVWNVLGHGAWVLLLLGMTSAAMVWAQLAPSTYALWGSSELPNFWWQLGAITLLVGVTLLCGWVQGVFHWRPTEVEFEPDTSADLHASGVHH